MALGLGERIEAWLQVRDAQRFQRDMDQSAKSIRKLRNETDSLNSSGLKLGQGLGGLRLSLGQFAALSLGAVPIVIGLAGTLGALTGSLGEASLGAGALGIAVGGVLLTNLLGVGLVVGRSIRDFHNVSTALNQYQLAVASYGRNSTQADTALRHLSGTVDKFGGTGMLRAVRNWQELGKSFDVMSAPGRASVGSIFSTAIEAAQKDLPAFTGMTNTALAAIERDSKGVFATLSSPEAQHGLRAFGDEFDRISGPLSRSVSNFFLFLLRTAEHLLPDVTKLAVGIEHFSDGLAKTSAQDTFGNKLDHLVDQTRSWWHLFMEVGGLIIDVLKPGANEGQSLVDTLTAGVVQLRLMASSVSGKRDLHNFFHDSIDNTIAFGKALWVVLGPLLMMARTAMPLWTQVLNVNATGLHAILSVVIWLSNVLSPFGGLLGIVIGGFWAWKAATLALAAAETVLTFVTGGWTTAFWALNAAIYANPIGALILGIGLLAAAFYLAYEKIGWFHNAVDSAFSYIRDHWPMLLIILTGPIGLAVFMIIKHFDSIKGAARSAIDGVIMIFNAGIGLINAITPGPLKIAGHVVIPGIPNIPKIPLLATGGVVGGFGSWISGEAGPELNTWDGLGVHVAPIRPAAVSGRGTVRSIDAGRLGNRDPRTLIVPVMLNGREIARAVADDTDDRLARQP